MSCFAVLWLTWHPAVVLWLAWYTCVMSCFVVAGLVRRWSALLCHIVPVMLLWCLVVVVGWFLLVVF